MRDGWYRLLVSEEIYCVQSTALRVNYIGLALVLCQFFNPNRVNIPTFPVYDAITSYNSRFAKLVSQDVRSANRYREHYGTLLVCVKHTRQTLRQPPPNQ